jgi:hypothetical protein
MMYDKGLERIAFIWGFVHVYTQKRYTCSITKNHSDPQLYLNCLSSDEHEAYGDETSEDTRNTGLARLLT